MSMNQFMGNKSALLGAKGIDLSGIMLVAANLIPLAGVLAWDWSVFHVVVIYWLENVLLGAINVIKMITCSPDPKQIDFEGKLRQRIGQKQGKLDEDKKRKVAAMKEGLETNQGKLLALHHASKLFFIPFFTFHYGFFCLIHGVFVFALLGKGEPGGGAIGFSTSILDEGAELLERAVQVGGFWAVLGLLVSHLFSFVVNYLGKGEFRRTAAPILMIAPYARIIVLHIAILAGAFAVVILGSPVYLLVILIVGKIMLDLKFHNRAHKKLEVAQASMRQD